MNQAKSATFKQKILLISFTIGFIVTVAEVTFRFLPVLKGIHGKEVIDKNDPVFHLRPNTTFTYSKGPRLRLVNHGKINNYGFVNDQEYENNGSRLLAVIGDSYIEAFMVPFEATLHGRLIENAKDKFRVYSFAASGAPLSQYLAWASFVNNEFQPQAMLFNIVGNDFDESLMDYKAGSGFYHYIREPNGDLRLELVTRDQQKRLFGILDRKSFLADILRSSMLVQYLIKNVKIHKLHSTIQNRARGDKGIDFVGNTAAKYDEKRIEDSKDIVQAFFRDLPLQSGLSPSEILFTIDGLRSAAYNPDKRSVKEMSYFGVMRSYFIKTAREKGYEVIDLDPVFFKEFQIKKRRFEWSFDGHWNGYAHGVVAEEIMESELFKKMLTESEVAKNGKKTRIQKK